jgi:hypothetical protein
VLPLNNIKQLITWYSMPYTSFHLYTRFDFMIEFELSLFVSTTSKTVETFCNTVTM